ncbi:MAG: DNA polymerase IV [SAR324 cluster bacterium]|nr:DNA polymerase IV [SAR324 cluster bacterium]
MDTRKIIHVDMDAFYASVEILDNPQFKGQPLIVGGSPENRGVVAAASYEVRKYGVHSAMASSRAKQLCPHAVFIKPRFSRYKDISSQIHQIFLQYTDLVETLALDEAWLDVTQNLPEEPSATILAQKIKTQILEEVGLTCSAGVSFNKFLAKIASDEKKPDGLFVIQPKNAVSFLLSMEVKKIPGVGKVTAKHLAEHGILVGHQLHEKTESFLVQHFGKFGRVMYERIRGIDHRPVSPVRERKSMSVETTFSKDWVYGATLLNELDKLIENLWKNCQKRSLNGRTVTLKIKFNDFQQITRSTSVNQAIASSEEMFQLCQRKLERVCQKEYLQKPIRLLGVGVSNFEKEGGQEAKQLDFFELIDHSDSTGNG